MDSVKVKFVDATGKIKTAAVLEIADTPETRARGLAKRASLDDGRGMFFDRAGVYWMKDVKFPLDLSFLSKTGEILETITMPVDQEGVFHYSPSIGNMHKSAHALETPMGFLAEHGVKPGDYMVVED